MNISVYSMLRCFCNILLLLFFTFSSCEKKEYKTVQDTAVLSQIIQTNSDPRKKTFSEKKLELRERIFNYTSDRTCVQDSQCRVLKIGRCWDLYSFSKVSAHLFCFDSIELCLSAGKNAIVFENQYN